MTDALRSLLRHVDALGTLEVRADSVRIPAPAIARLHAVGVLRPGANVTDVVCPGCDFGCVVVPQRRPTVGGGEVIVIPCTERDDVGLVRIDPDRLRTWRVDLAAIGARVAGGLGLRGVIVERVSGRCWELGTRPVDGQRRTFFLVWGLGRPEIADIGAAMDQAVTAPGTVILVPDAVAVMTWKPPGPILAISRLLAVDDAGLLVDVEAVLAILVNTKAPKGSTIRPFPTPAGATWERLVIRVVDNEHVELGVGAAREVRSYREFGMADARKKDVPDEVWALLLVFARVQGSLSWIDSGAKRTIPQKLSRLRALLREVFGIEGDPFHGYTAERGWEARFTIRDLREFDAG